MAERAEAGELGAHRFAGFRGDPRGRRVALPRLLLRVVDQNQGTAGSRVLVELLNLAVHDVGLSPCGRRVGDDRGEPCVVERGEVGRGSLLRGDRGVVLRVGGGPALLRDDRVLLGRGGRRLAGEHLRVPRPDGVAELLGLHRDDHQDQDRDHGRQQTPSAHHDARDGEPLALTPAQRRDPEPDRQCPENETDDGQPAQHEGHDAEDERHEGDVPRGLRGTGGRGRRRRRDRKLRSFLGEHGGGRRERGRRRNGGVGRGERAVAGALGRGGHAVSIGPAGRSDPLIHRAGAAKSQIHVRVRLNAA